MSPAEGAIGLFDSGIGGTTVLAEVRRLLPDEDLLYLADQAHCPYGPRPVEELRTLALAGAGWLIDQGAKVIVVACNSASGAALTLLREHFPQIPFVGMVPAVKPATMATRSGVVGVLATPATIGGGLLREVVERWAGHVQVLTQPCDGLADAVEHGEIEAPATAALIERYVAPLVAAGADTLVLGCTHYPFLLPQIRAIVGPEITLIDPAPAVARQTRRVLADHTLQRLPDSPARVTYATTGDPQALADLIARLGLPEGRVVRCEPIVCCPE